MRIIQYVRGLLYKVKIDILMKSNHILLKKIIIYILLVIVTILFNGSYLSFDYLSNTDEFSSIASIMTLTGVDWSGVSAGSSYHGFGGIIYLLPLILLFPAINIYKTILVGCLIVRIACVILTYEIAVEIFENSSKKAIVLAIICNIGSLQPDTSAALSAMTEVPITFVTLVVSYLIYLGIKKEKQRIIYWVSASIVTGFASCIHSRIIIMYFSLIVCLVLMMAINRKINITVVIVGMSFVLSYFLTKLLINYVNQKIYMTSDPSKIVTSTSGILQSRLIPYLSKLFDVQQCFIIIKTLLAQFGNYSILSFGLIWILWLANISFVIDNLKKITKKEIDKRDQIQLLLTLFGMINFIVMIVSICISSTGSIKSENYRWYSYLRYSMPYAWIFVLTGFSKLDVKRYSPKILVIIFMLVPLLLEKYLLYVICNDLDKSGYSMSYNLFNRIFFCSNDSAFSYYLRIGIVVLLISGLVCFLTIKTKKTTFIYMSYIISSILIGSSIFSYFYSRELGKRELVNASIEYVTNNKEEFENKEVYIIGSANYKYNIQMKCPNISLKSITTTNAIDAEEFIVFSDKKIEEIKNLNEIELDNNEYLYYSSTRR